MTAEDSGTDRRGFVQAAVAGAGAGKFSLAPIAPAQASLTFNELLADRRYQFVDMLTPVPLQGATGSCGCPIAIT